MQKIKRLVIAVDYDDVIVQTSMAVLKYYNETHGTSIKPEEFYSDDPAIWGVDTIEEAVLRVEAFHASDKFYAIAPTDEAIRVLTDLSKHHELHVVTGRSENLADATKNTLNKYLPGIFTSVEFTNFFTANSRSKADVCRQLGADLLIDDNLHHSEVVAASGTKVLLFGEYAWNQSHTPAGDVTRTKDWQAVKELLIPAQLQR